MTSTSQPEQPPSRQTGTPLSRVVLGAVAAGLGLRLMLLIHAGWRYDYDEGMVGLQVLRILHGARPVFHPGQPYLAALESYLIAPLFAVFGANAVTLKFVPLALSGVYIGTTGWLAYRAFDRKVAALSALLAAFAPTYLLVVGTKTWGATAETLVLGNLSLICTSMVFDGTRRQQRRALIALGLILGIAFWVSWLIMFYVVPIAIGLLLWGRAALRRWWWAAAVTFLIGSAPLWGYNLAHDWATFRYLLNSPNDGHPVWAVLDHLNYDLSPRLVSGDPAWHLLSWPAIWWLQSIYEGGLIVVVLSVWRGPWALHKRPSRALLALFAAGLPVIYVASGYGYRALNPFGFDATGRYVLMIHSALPIGAAALAMWLSRPRWKLLVGPGIVTSVIALNLLGAARANPVQVFVSPYYTRQPATLQPLIAFLDDEGIRDVWTDVGIAHVLMFETHERILAADWYDIYGAKGIVRFPEVPLKIARADRVAFVEVVLPDQTETRFEDAFRTAGIPYRAVRVTPDLLVIIPQHPIDPALVGDGLGYQF